MTHSTLNIKAGPGIILTGMLITLIFLVFSGFNSPGGNAAVKNLGCSYTIVLTVAPNSTGTWCIEPFLGAQLYQANRDGIATFTNLCKGTYYFCDESGTVYSVVVDGSALTYYPVATSLKCPCI
jgi:hypothetical protein